MSKHVYQNKEAVRIYDRSHGLKGKNEKYIKEFKQFRNQVVDKIVDKVNQSFSLTQTLRILDIGVGHGDYILIPLLTELTKNNKEVYVIGIDNSNEMLDFFKANYGKVINTRKIKIKTMYKDIEQMWLEGDYKNSFNKDGFNLILLMGVLHHVTNWRLILEFVVNAFLAQDGYILLSERNYESDFLDGNFYQNSTMGGSHWKEIWKHYYKNRIHIGIPWEPELRISDYSPVFYTLILNGFQKVFEIKDSWKICYKKNEFLKWLSEPAFSNFYRFLKNDDIKKLHKMIKEYLCEKKFPSDVNVQEGWKVVMFRRN